MISLLLFFGLCALFFAALYDLKYREVPDLLTYGFVVGVVGMTFIEALVTQLWIPFLYTMGTGIVFFLIAMALFYSGHWGGGDSKLLIGSAMLFTSFYPFVFLLLIFVTGALYGVLYTITLFFIHYKKSLHYYRMFTTKGQHKLIFMWSWLVGLLFLGVGLFSSSITALFFYFLSGVSFFLPVLWSMIKTVEETVLIEWMPLSKLTEGEWLAEPVKKGKRVILEKPRLGIENKDIKLLKKNNINKVLIKKGMPFIPAFFFAAVVTIAYGQWLVSFLF